MFSRHRHLFLFTAALIVFCSFSHAQRGYRWEFGVGAGVSNYLGDIGGKADAAKPFIADMKLAKTRWNTTAFVKYRFDPLFALRLAYNYMRIEGADKLSTNPGRQGRNLSFRNDVMDLEATIHWYIYNSQKPIGVYSRSNVYLTAYLFAGIGGYHHNPKAEYQGTWTSLQPLQTEAVSYSKYGYCLPFGAGVFFTVNKRRRSHRIGVEVNWRYTNTDYLDDISTVYVNPSQLSSATSIALSNRNPELQNQPEGFDKNYGWQGTDANGDPVNKAPRGNSDNKDSFLSFSVTYGIALKKSKSSFRKSRGRKIRSVSF